MTLSRLSLRNSLSRSLLLLFPVLMLASWNPLAASAATPAVTITAPLGGATVSGNAVGITAQVSTGVSWINIYIDGNYLNSSPPFTFTWDSTGVVNGSHAISANAYSSSGSLLGSASATVNVQNANAKPAVKLTSPATASTVSGNVTLSAQVNTSVSWIDFEIDGTFFAASPPFSTTWDSTSVGDGAHVIQALAFNNTGTQIGSDSVNVTVSNHVVGGGGGPISVRSTSTGSTATSADRITINVPAGVSMGDVLIAQVAVRGGAGVPLTGPPGWILAAHNDTASSIVQAVFYHVVPAAPAEPASYTFTFLNTSNDAAGGIIDYVGVDNVNPIDDVVGGSNASSNTIVAPATSIPATHTTDRLVATFAASSSSGMTLPGALTREWNFHAVGYGIEVALGDLNLTTATATAQTATLPSAVPNVGQEIALAPAGGSSIASADRTSSNAPGVVVSGTTVTALVPFGSDDTAPKNGAEVVVENSSGTLPAAVILTTDRINSCAAFASTGAAICSGQGGTADFLANGAATATVVSDGISANALEYTGGDCAACGVAIDDFLGLGILATNGGFQLLNPIAQTVGPPIPGNNEPVPVDFGYDPIGHRILSANYQVTDPATFASSPPHFEIFNLYRSSNEVFDLLNDAAFFEPANFTCTGTGASNRDILPDTTAIDTSTNVALVTFHNPAVCFTNPFDDIALFDLSQVKFTTTGKAGLWDTAGKQIQNLTGLHFGDVAAVSVVSGGHVAIISGQFNSNLVGALKLPTTSGSGVPAISDYVKVAMPNDPSGKAWNNWHQPSGVGSYTSPNNGKPYGVIMNFGQDANSNPIGPTYVAVVDLQALLAAPRDSSNHAVASSVNLVTGGIVRFVKVQ